MYESSNATINNTGGFNSQLSFYEYPTHKPFINTIHQPIRPSNSLSKTVSLPESKRDQLLSSLQSLSLKIKNLESEREKAELSLHEITNGYCRPSIRRQDPQGSVDEQLREAEENFRRLQHQHKRVLQILNEHRPPKAHTSKKKKRSARHNQSFDSLTPANADGRHYHLDMNDVPFILGKSTSPSHNVKSNVQNVIALLKKHNHQLCLSSKEYHNLLHSRQKGEISPHTLLYLDHYNKPSNRPLSASPTRQSNRRSNHISPTRRPQTASNNDSQCSSRIKCLRREYAVLSREHTRLNSTQSSSDDLEIITRRMNNILEELGQLQKQYLKSSEEHMEQDLNETPIETLRRTKLLQLILKDPIEKQNKY